MPAPDAPDAVVAALWGAFALWVGYWFVPMLVSGLGGSGYANGGEEEDPAAVEPDGTDPAYAAWSGALRQLGYEPLGAGWMRVTFHLRWWVYRTTVRAFRNPAAGRFAFLHDQPAAAGWHQPVFATCWADGGLLLTAAGEKEARLTADGLLAEQVASFDPAEAEARHSAAAAAWAAEGRRPDPDLRLTTLLDASARHAAATTLRPAARTARTDLLAMALMLAPVPAGLAAWLGPWHWAPPAGGLAVLAFFAYVMAWDRARIRRLARAAEPADEGW